MSPEIDTGLASLRAFAEQHGVGLRVVSEVELVALDEAFLHSSPFSLDIGFCVAPGAVYLYWSVGQEDPDTCLGGLVHELGHLLVGGDLERGLPEYDWLGWEYAVARLVGIEKAWRANMQNYIVETEFPHTKEFRTLSPIDQQALLEERLAYAIQVGLVRDGIPLKAVDFSS